MASTPECYPAGESLLGKVYREYVLWDAERSPGDPIRSDMNRNEFEKERYS